MRKGFSLIELLVVILIISLVYFLGFEKFELGTSKPKPLSPINLKEEILKSKVNDGDMTLMCLDNCRKCYLRSGLSSSFQPYPNAIDLQGIKAYTLDENDALVDIEYGRYDDKKICLLMHFYNNGSATQLILENEEGSYFLPSFFDTVQYFDSPEDAKEHWVTKSQDLSDSGAFY